MAALTILIAVFGAFIGSFLNVVIYRVPKKLSVVSPPSSCPACGARIRPWQNVPVLSWLVLRGSCASCHSRISARYPLVELGTALLFGAVTWWWAAVGPGAAAMAALSGAALPASGVSQVIGAVLVLGAFLYLASISIALAFIDLDHHLLPNSIVLPAYAVGGVMLTASAILTGNSAALLGAAVGGAAMFVFYFALAFISPRGMGMGDVKLAGVLGLFLGYLGWGALLVGGFGAFLLGGLFSILLIAMKRAGRKSGIPFGPWMLLAAWLGVFLGEELWASYLGLFGLEF